MLQCLHDNSESSQESVTAHRGWLHLAVKDSRGCGASLETDQRFEMNPQCNITHTRMNHTELFCYIRGPLPPTPVPYPLLLVLQPWGIRHEPPCQGRVGRWDHETSASGRGGRSPAVFGSRVVNPVTGFENLLQRPRLGLQRDHFLSPRHPSEVAEGGAFDWKPWLGAHPRLRLDGSTLGRAAGVLGKRPRCMRWRWSCGDMGRKWVAGGQGRAIPLSFRGFLQCLD